MSEAVRAMCEELTKAVNVMMDAESSQIYRLEALKVTDQYHFGNLIVHIIEAGLIGHSYIDKNK